MVFLEGGYVERSFAERAVFGAGDFVVRPTWCAHDGASQAGARYAHLPLTEPGVRSFLAFQGWRAWRGRLPLDRLRDLAGDPAGGDALLAVASVRPLDDYVDDTLHLVARELDSESGTPIEHLAEKSGIAPWTLSR